MPPPPFSERSPLGEHAKWRCDTPPSKGVISAIRARYPMKTRQMGAIPPSAYYLERIWGGVSRTGPLREQSARSRGARLSPLDFSIQRLSEKLEKAGTVDFKKHPARKVGTRSRQCGPKVSGRFAFPGARSPRICSISRFGKIYPAIFPEFSELSCRTPAQTPETATAFSSFQHPKSEHHKRPMKPNFAC